MTTTCQVCNVAFAAQRRTRRYCSETCRAVVRQGTVKSRRRAANLAAAAVPLGVLDPADVGWLAGIIDGEGTVCLSRGGNKRVPHLRLSLVNTSDSILDRCRRIFAEAGIKWSEGVVYRKGGCQTSLVIGTRDALRLYPVLRPQLVRQVERYDVCVAWLAPHYVGRLRVAWTATECDEWEALRQRFNVRH